MKVLIAEDMKPMVRNLEHQLRSIEPRIRLIRTAYNGIDALKILQNEPIDILITDIRMPMMDGLQLIEEAVAIQPKLRSILLTGYKDFEYARKAIELNVCEYLLKPLDLSKLKRVIHKLIHEITKQKAEQYDDWLLHAATDERAAFSLLGETPKELLADRYLFFALRYRSEQVHHIEATKRFLRSVIEARFPGNPVCIAKAMEISDYMLLVPLMSDQDAETIHEEIHAIYLDLLQEYSDIHLIYECIHAKPDQFSERYKQLLEVLEQTYVLNHSQLLHMDDHQPAELDYSKAEVEQLSLQFQTMIKQHADRESFAQAFKQFLTVEEREPVRRFKHRLTLITDILSNLLGEKLDLEREIDRLFVQETSYENVIDAFLTRYLLPHYDQLDTRRGSAQEAIQAIEDYLVSNVYNNISLRTMSRDLNYSASYIIRIFKKHKGTTPMEYYTMLKIEEAKRLITENEHMLFKDIAEALGFNDQHYFTKVFKQYAGQNPSEYKMTIMSKA